jgi:nucleolar protein 12
MGIFDSLQIDEKLNSFFQKEKTVIQQQPIKTTKLLAKINNTKEVSTEENTMEVDDASDADSVVVDVNIDAASDSDSENESVSVEIEQQDKSVEKLDDGTRSFKIKQLIEKNQKTIFIGNLPTKIMEKPETKLLKQEFQKYGKLLSIRYRSIAFNMKLPRKQAFIQKKFHENRDSVNAYLVYSSAEEAKSALEMNGKLFMSRHIRVDFVETKAQKQRDSQRCIFVGNLAFDVSDETIWGFFADVGEIGR